MPISTINRVKTIAIELNPFDSNISTIYESTKLTIGEELIPNHYIISFNTFFKNLRAYAQISSVSEALMPDFKLEDSETDRLYKTLDIEWKSPRKQLSLYISSQSVTEPEGQGWFPVGSISLLNPSGYPYRIYNLMDLYTDNLAIELGDNSKLGIKVDDVGYGLLNVTDKVTVHGSYVEEIFVQSPEPTYVNFNANNTPSVPITPTPTTPIANLMFSFLSIVFRLSAGDLTLNNNDLVSTWRQPNENNLVVTQNIEANKPTYKTNILNGKNAVYFDGISNFLEVQQISDGNAPLSLIPSFGDWMIFLVAKFDGADKYAFSSFTTGIDYSVNISISGNYTEIGYFNPYNDYRTVSVSYVLDAEWNTYILSRSGGDIKLHINGVLHPVGYVDGSMTSERDYLNSLYIGKKNTNTNFLNGYIADVGITDNYSVANMNKIGEYFKSLYNLTWTTIEPDAF